MHRLSVLVSLLALSTSCGGAAAPPVAPVSSEYADEEAPAEADAEPAPRPPFDNPGGMWMPQQIPAHAETLRGLGLELDPAALSDPTSAPLSAVVSLGGCSASFVSPEGLIITNHHCIQGALQYHSSPEENLVETGFLAATRADEKWNGPTARVYVTESIEDVTARVLDGLAEIAGDRERYDAIEERQKELIAECEKDRPHVRCRVARFFQGAEFHRVAMLEIRDVRLVYAPHAGIGFFGGDEDNWMWPRHTGDYAFYRAYVGPDGKPAAHAPENVPYRPAHHLPVASQPLAEGDLVMVTGYPGSSGRHRTAAEVAEAVEWSYPRGIESAIAYIAALERAAAADPDAAIKAQPRIFGLQNRLKNNQGMLDGLVKGGLAGAKATLEAELRAWIGADDERRAAWGGVLDELGALQAAQAEHRVRDAGFGELRQSQLLGVARMIVRMAEERPRPDAERDPSYQERNWERMRAGQRAFGNRYNRVMDRELLITALQRGAGDPANGDWLSVVLGGKRFDRAAIERRVDALYRTTELEDEAVRLRLLDGATLAQLRRSRDPLIRLALALRGIEKEMEERAKREAGALALLRPRYLAALRAYSGDLLAPDANGTLRVTFGTVKGYRPTPDAEPYTPFTLLPEVVAKHRGEKPFDVPAALRAAVAAGKRGAYVDRRLGDVPVNYLADLDITGGNSGSPTLNGRGELVGLAFDGNYEAMASDWLFLPELTRSIHVDMRYVLWIMDAVDGAHHLLREMGVEPSAAPSRASGG